VIRRFAAPRKEYTVAEIRTEEHPQSNVLPWLLGLALLALVIIGLVLSLADSASGADVIGPREAGSTQEKKKKDETPRRLQQWAFAGPAAAGPARAA
jgi:hypothetical protein